MKKSIVGSIADQSEIDRFADPLQRGVSRVLRGAPAVASVLHGKWLGHPLHAALTDVPTGAWTSGFVLDLASEIGGARKLRAGADALQVIGLVGAIGAAMAGLADWSRTRQSARRVGFVHAVLNSTVAALAAASIVARGSGRRATGVALSSAGLGIMIASSWLGGELSYRFGVGVIAEGEPNGVHEHEPTTADVHAGT